MVWGVRTPQSGESDLLKGVVVRQRESSEERQVDCMPPPTMATPLYTAPPPPPLVSPAWGGSYAGGGCYRGVGREPVTLTSTENTRHQCCQTLNAQTLKPKPKPTLTSTENPRHQCCQTLNPQTLKPKPKPHGPFVWTPKRKGTSVLSFFALSSN